MYRHTSKGGWTFSVQDNGWQVSDCTAEGLKVYRVFYFKDVTLVTWEFLLALRKSNAFCLCLYKRWIGSAG